MSHLKIPPFDLLLGRASPYAGFGVPLVASPAREGRLLAQAEAAKQRLMAGFGCQLSTVRSASLELDGVIDGMWSTGWSPEENDVNLFVTDFGLVLASRMLADLGGEPLLRSESDVSHFSIWWPEKRVEAFPFHKVLKCVTCRDGESIEWFVEGLSRLIERVDR